MTAKPSPLPCIYYFAFSADHIGFVAASLATYFHQDLNVLVASGNENYRLVGGLLIAGLAAAALPIAHDPIIPFGVLAAVVGAPAGLGSGLTI